MAIELIVDVPVLKGEKGDKGDTGEFSYGHLEEIVEEHLDDRFEDVEAALDGKVDAVEDNGLVPTAITLKLTGVDELDETVASILTDVLRSDDVDNLEASLQASLQNYIDDIAIELGTGDMLKSVYDTNNDGIVDLAAKADDADTVGGNTVLTDVPADAVFTDTTYSEATTSAAGLMSAADKSKLNGVETGAQVNTVTGIKGSAETNYRTGNVIITRANLGLDFLDEEVYSKTFWAPKPIIGYKSGSTLTFNFPLPKRVHGLYSMSCVKLVGGLRGASGYVQVPTGQYALDMTDDTDLKSKFTVVIEPFADGDYSVKIRLSGASLANVPDNSPVVMTVKEIEMTFSSYNPYSEG